MKTIVQDDQRALLYRNGRFVRLLEPGVHRRLGTGWRAQIMDISREFLPEIGHTALYLHHPEFEGRLDAVVVGDGQLALHYEDDRFAGLLGRGQYAFWRTTAEHRFALREVSNPEISDIPRSTLLMMGDSVCTVEVRPHQKALLFYDGAFVKLLGEGSHFFWDERICGVKVTTQPMDARLQQLNVQGQEVLALDKVAVRINFVCRYRIVDCVRAAAEFQDHAEQLHVAAQLTLREYVGRHRLDELLEDREEMARHAFEALKSRESEFFIELVDAGVRDIILPGEIREIMNTVLVAEKKAQANVIARREEVASTRSLLNTARLMDENKTLMRLKEMEHLERICENVGSINVGGGDLIRQLSQLAGGQTPTA